MQWGNALKDMDQMFALKFALIVQVFPPGFPLFSAEMNIGSFFSWTAALIG